MKVSVLLADKGTANLQARTLNLLNIGWSHTVLRPLLVPPMAPGQAPQMQLMTPPHAVAVFYEVEHMHCNHPIALVFSLESEDGQPVSVAGPVGRQPMVITQNITVPSPPQAPIGSPGVGNTLLEVFPGLAIEPGTYSWRVELDGEANEDWRARFYVLAPPQQPLMTFLQPPRPTEGDG